MASTYQYRYSGHKNRRRDNVPVLLAITVGEVDRVTLLNAGQILHLSNVATGIDTSRGRWVGLQLKYMRILTYVAT
ncbi:uncharacterized protein N7525_003245 [Penicillium rubens]|jgi:hypothetical protein|uniref:uncharacterized protein n=1 Tax=Penicillium rubens TaxID=1108849 RepID=UPI002A5A51E2|nr:uncharacterized protein N7525_003245 [Penicillium rubens]KAJ5838057.1 hypothetical protein N7525_003245 [Penicillium rubens]KAJ5866102.1 hypothetical protein N7534_000655 [Penicillium rubens]